MRSRVHEVPKSSVVHDLERKLLWFWFSILQFACHEEKKEKRSIGTENSGKRMPSAAQQAQLTEAAIQRFASEIASGARILFVTGAG